MGYNSWQTHKNCNISLGLYNVCSNNTSHDFFPFNSLGKIISQQSSWFLSVNWNLNSAICFKSSVLSTHESLIAPSLFILFKSGSVIWLIISSLINNNNLILILFWNRFWLSISMLRIKLDKISNWFFLILNISSTPSIKTNNFCGI